MHTYDIADADHRHARPAPAVAAGPDGLLGLQRTAGNAGVTALVQRQHERDEADQPPVLDVLSAGGGRPLDAPVRSEMEARLGHRFDDVRVHTDARADASARSVNAAAYTVGSNVVFQRDRYDPASSAGKELLAHELTHVVQQRNGPVDGSPVGGGVRVSDPGDRFEREAAATAERAMAAPLPQAPAASAGAGVQRVIAVPEEDEEDRATAVQGAFLQRQSADEDELEA